MLVVGILVGILLTLAVGAVWFRRSVLAPLDRLTSSEQSSGLRPAPRIAALDRSLTDRQSALDTDSGVRHVMESALRQMQQGVLVVGATGDEVLRNPVADGYLSDTHTGALLRPRVDEILLGARTSGQVDEEINVFGPPARTFLVSARTLETDPAGVLVVLEDVTDLQRLHDMRRDFVANLSHELKTPVGAISLLAETVVDETDPDTVGRLTGRLVDESSRLAHVIDDLLALSHIEHDEQPPHTPVDVFSVIADAAGRVGVAADARRVSIDRPVAGEPLMVDGDPQQLLSAVTNLLENAIKYSDEEGTVIVRVAVTGSATESQVEISVRDQGRGIPQSDLGRIFERFYRVDRSRESATGGTGLGLAIVRHVAINHGGSVTVASVEGDGSTFTLRLPKVR